MPTAFPEGDFRAFGIAAAAFFPRVGSYEAEADPQQKLVHFTWSWAAVRYRYRGCFECKEQFEGLLSDPASDRWKGGGSDEELTYKLDRCIYQFFTSGLSVFDSFSFCLYFYGNALKPDAFPEVAHPRNITRSSTAKAFNAAFSEAAITRLLVELSKDTRFSAIEVVRNLLGHRTIGRRSIRPLSTTGGNGTYTPGYEQTWHLPGTTENLEFNEDFLQRHLTGISALLSSLSSAAREFAESQKEAKNKPPAGQQP